MRKLIVLAALLGACQGAEEGTEGDVTNDVYDPTAPYGPENNWYSAANGEVDTQSGEAWQIGAKAPNFAMPDQFGDVVELYQFTGKLVMLTVMPDPGTEVTEIVEGCVS